jgi:hypothetical protein
LSLFDIFRQKRIYSLSDFSADLTEADFQSLLPGFSEHIVDVVHRASIQFYRDIHSHEASPFPKVKDEFFYLIYFVSDKTIRSLFPANADMLSDTLHEIINRKISEIDRSFSKDQFWSAYLVREETYSALYTQPVRGKDVFVPESLPYVFSSFLQQHIDCPETIVRHHGIQMAGEAIFLLEGRR